MKTLKYTLLFCLLLVSSIASAQIKRISGTVSDDFDVLPGVNVQEVDASGRTVNATVTDMNGNFVLAIKSQKNKLKVSYVGMKAQVLPINKTVFKIMMADNATTLKDVEVKAKKMMKTSGLAIPEREVSFAAQGISSKEFEGLGITSVDEALQGRIAGLDIVMNSGDLGAGTSMRLRGASTISTLTSTEPLIVVNGNVLTDVDQSDFDVSTATEEKFAELLKVNTEDIEDIKVLKDAAATAIWGSQGANGVIEITTKRGSRGPAKVSYSLKLTMTHQPAGIKLLNGDQYTMMLKEAYFNPAQSATASDINEISYLGAESGFTERYMYNNNTDWVDAVKQNGLRQNHYISISGGDEKTTFRISGGFDHETGTIIKQVLNRFSTRMALDYYVNDRIKLVSNFALTYTDNQRNYEKLLPLARRKMPNMAIYREYIDDVPSSEYYYQLVPGSGSPWAMPYIFSHPSNKPEEWDQVEIPNLVAVANLATNRNKNYQITPELILEYKLLGTNADKHQLNYRGQVLVNVSNDYVDMDYPRELSTDNWLNQHTASSSASKSFNFMTRHTLTFTPHFENEDHYLTAMGRFEMNSGYSTSQFNGAYRLPDGVSTPVAGGVPNTLTSGYGEWRSLFYTLSAHYSYKSRYMFDASLRVDGVTKFGPNKRWGYFPSVSGRWNIIDEPWMKWAREKAKISMLSVRPGWGFTGNAPSGNYLYMNTYSVGAQYLGQSVVSSNGVKLTDLKWETRYSLNVGFDLGFLDDRLKFAFEIYQLKTENMLLPGYRIPSSNGFGSIATRNVGDLKNTGWEFYINGDRLAKKGKFWLDFNVNFADNKNVITALDASVLESYNSDITDVYNDQLLSRVQLNNSFGSIYGFRSHGVYQYGYEAAQELAKKDPQLLQSAINSGKTYPVVLNAAGEVVYDIYGNPKQMRCNYDNINSRGYKFQGGDAIYEDVNHDGNINKYDIVYLGNSLPKLTGGFGFKLHYDKLTLNAQFNYRLNYDIYNQARMANEAMNNNNNQSEAVNYRWRKDGDVTTIPRASNERSGYTNYNTLVSDRFIEDGTFLRLNYLQLSYNFDSKKLKKYGLNQLNLYVSANNLFCLTKYSGVDPEIGYYGVSQICRDNGQNPRPKSYTVGITIGF